MRAKAHGKSADLLRGLKPPPPSVSSLCGFAAQMKLFPFKAKSAPTPYFFGAAATATNESAQP
jgi:hypothetical protein